MTFTSLLKIFGWLLLTSSLCMAGANIDDPNMRQFLEQDKKQTQGEYCASCVEKAMSASSVSGLVIDVRAALKETKPADRQATRSAISLKDGSSSSVVVDLNTSSFDQETARQLAEKIKSNSVSTVSTIKIFYREDLANMRRAILRQIRQALQSQSASQGSSAQTSKVSADAEDESSIRLGDYVNFNGQKVRIEMYSSSDENSNARVQMIASGGKPRVEGSYYYALDNKSQVNVSSSLAGSKSNSITVQFVRAWD